MPRTADHEARRAEIAAAVHRLVAADGLDAATVAAVAREAGISVGLVQHYFRSKDDMLLFAYRQVTQAVRGRVAACIDAARAQQRTIRAIVQESLGELLPLDAGRRGEYRVTRAFLGRSLENPTLADVARTGAADLRDQIALAVHNGKECGEVADELDPQRAATRITALVDGLADQLYQAPERTVGGHRLATVADELVADCLAGVFTGECRQYAP